MILLAFSLLASALAQTALPIGQALSVSVPVRVIARVLFVDVVAHRCRRARRTKSTSGEELALSNCARAGIWRVACACACVCGACAQVCARNNSLVRRRRRPGARARLRWIFFFSRFSCVVKRSSAARACCLRCTRAHLHASIDDVFAKRLAAALFVV